MKNTGQAAMTDALFFLLVVSGLATSLFVFTASFGKDVSTFIESRHNSTYALSALKTILYSNAPRANASLALDDARVKEVDFLMTLIKEDYANLSENNDGFVVDTAGSEALRKNIDSVMLPINKANDYLVYLQAEKQVFFFPFIYTRLLFEGEEKAFFCSPGLAFREKLDAFVVRMQANGRSVVPVELRSIQEESRGNYDLRSDEGEMGIIIWRTRELSFADSPFNPNDWRCTLVS